MGCCGSKKQEDEISRKIAVVGDNRVGKTCLIQRYIKDEFDEDTPSSYIPSALQVDEKIEVLNNGKKIHLYIYDLGGRDTFKHLKRLNYPKAEAAIICFSIDDKASLESVKTNWVTDMKKACPGIPMILVGLKQDRRAEAGANDDFVRESNGQSVAKKNNLVKYLECSSMTGTGVKEVFSIIAREAAKVQPVEKTDD